MAKKSRRVKKNGQRIRLSPTQMVQPGADETAAVSTIAAQVRSSAQGADLREEYQYVITDLKRIGLIAAAMVVLLVALALLLT